MQENAPERDDVKAAIFAELDALVPPDVVVASSSSSMLPSRLAAMCPGTRNGWSSGTRSTRCT